jgi:hypothetical protein
MSSPNSFIGDPFFEKLDSRSPIMAEDKFRGNDVLIIPSENLVNA